MLRPLADPLRWKAPPCLRVLLLPLSLLPLFLLHHHLPLSGLVPPPRWQQQQQRHHRLLAHLLMAALPHLQPLLLQQQVHRRALPAPAAV